MHFKEKYQTFMNLYAFDLFQFHDYYREGNREDQDYIDIITECEWLDNRRFQMEQNGNLWDAPKLQKKLEKNRLNETYTFHELDNIEKWLEHYKLICDYTEVIIIVGDHPNRYLLLAPLTRLMDDYVFEIRKGGSFERFFREMNREIDYLKSKFSNINLSSFRKQEENIRVEPT